MRAESFFDERPRKKRRLLRRRRSRIRCRWPWGYGCAHRRCARFLREDRRLRCRRGGPRAGTNRLPRERGEAVRRRAVRERWKRGCERLRLSVEQEESKATCRRVWGDARQRQRKRAELSGRKGLRFR